MTAFHRSAEWQRLVRQVRPQLQALIDQGMAACIDCGRPIMPGDEWQVGHRLAHRTHPQLSLVPSNLGPSHGGRRRQSCNQRAGAQLGNKLRADRAARRTGMIPWR